MSFPRLTFGLLIIGISALLTYPAAAQVISESIPHQPNFLGKNICLGIESPADKIEWRSPKIDSIITLTGTYAEHQIIFDQNNVIYVTESKVNKNSCSGIDIDIAKWNSLDKIDVCLKPWDGDVDYIRVKISEKHSSNINENYLKRSIYSVGSCKIGIGSIYYQYGEILKVESIHVNVE